MADSTTAAGTWCVDQFDVHPGKVFGLLHLFLVAGPADDKLLLTNLVGTKKIPVAVVEKVVNKHGGRIEVNSAPGSGTTFKIILKLKF